MKTSREIVMGRGGPEGRINGPGPALKRRRLDKQAFVRDLDLQQV